MEVTNIVLLEGYISKGYILERALVSDTKAGHSILEIVLKSDGKTKKMSYRDNSIPEVKKLLLKKFPQKQILDK